MTNKSSVDIALMRIHFKYVLFLFSLLISFNLGAQKIDRNYATELINKNMLRVYKKKVDFNPDEIVSFYKVPSSGLTMVHLQQKYKGVPVFGCMKVLAFKEDTLFSIADNYFDLDKINSKDEERPLIKPERAVLTALHEQAILYYKNITPISIVDKIYHFGTLGVANKDITCSLIWVPVDEWSVKLSWQIELLPISSSDHLLIRVDAIHNTVLDKNNYTVYEKFKNEDSNNENNNNQFNNIESWFNEASSIISTSPASLNAKYNLIPFPFESPNHLIRQLDSVSNPWQISFPNDTIFKWHNDGYIIHDSTKGNNVWAQEDRDNNNLTFGKSAISTTFFPNLNFNYLPDYNVNPTDSNSQKFAITNLFYWNNLMHDLSYNYGFDEVSGNFQANNSIRGGIGNDFVIADAQDAGRLNNANFTTPVDGVSPRMQMYLFNTTFPLRDADLDNGIIIHEYTHGISNRLTGGPSNSSCLSNAEQAGEGWSDYFALMMTTDWSTANIQDGAKKRPLGTYVLGDSITGRGVRRYPYSTNKSIDPLTYGMIASLGGEVHKIGEIWCSALWDMTWNIIMLEGINPDIFTPNVLGGNSIALKLVMEGMRLQPCRPGFIDSRNAILKADTLFFNGKYSCAIWSAFAGRGMGKNAQQGSSNNTKDQVEDFLCDIGLQLKLRQSLSDQHEGGLITYFNEVKSGQCFDLINYDLCDTLPLNVEYVSGGSYDSNSRVIHFAVNLQQGQSQVYPFTVKIKRNAYFLPINFIQDSVSLNTFSRIWQIPNNDTFSWKVTSEESNSRPFSLYSKNYGYITDNCIETIESFSIPVSSSPMLNFQSNMQCEMNWDGGVVEISIDSGRSWNDLGNYMIKGYYNGKINVCGNPLSGRPAFTGNSYGFVKTAIDLSSFEGNSVKIRFRFATDETNFINGWFLDDIHFVDTAVVKVKSSIYSPANICYERTEIIARILPPLPCIPVSILQQPDSLNLCEHGSGEISIRAEGTGINYQWQVSSDNGENFYDMIGENNSVLFFSNAALSMTGKLYRCILRDSCSNELISGTSRLMVFNLPSNALLSSVSRCGVGAISLSVPTDSNVVVDWYLSEFTDVCFNSNSIYQTPSLNSNTTYWISKRDTLNGCISAQRVPYIIHILDVPAPPRGMDSSRCGPGSVGLKIVDQSCNQILWYNQSAGGLLLDTGIVFRTPFINVNTTYFAASKSINGCISSSRASLVAKINPVPASITSVTGSLKCSGETAVLTAVSASGHSVKWYADSIGAILLHSALNIGTSVFTTSSIQHTTTYWVANYNSITGCISAEKRPAVVLIYPRPPLPSVNPGSRCGSGRITLSVTSPSSNLSYDWYDVSTGGTILASSTNITTPIIVNSINYYVESRTISTGCKSDSRFLAKAIVLPLPNPPVSIGNNTRCGPGDILLKVSANAEYSMDWYSASSGGLPVKTNSDFLKLVNISTSNSFYVSSRDIVTGCTSSIRSKITANVLPILPAPSTLTGTANICPYVGTNNSLLYAASQVQGALNYFWTIPSGASIDSGNNGLKIKLRYQFASPNDSLIVQANNGCLGLKKSLKLFTSNCLSSALKYQYADLKKSSEYELRIYPNPAEVEFRGVITSITNEMVYLNVYNIQGKRIKSFLVYPNIEFNFGNDLPPGMYLVGYDKKFQKNWIKVVKVN